jgi:predicted nucleotidyltransferase component of viral defense system
MIDQASLTEWRSFAPWVTQNYVEQDLIISKALVHIFNHELLASKLIFKGGTALQKLFYKNNPTRYSEDIDLTQMKAGPIGPIFDGLKAVLDPWLGNPKRKLGEGRATLIYKFQPTNSSELGMKLKIEINTREHFSFFDVIKIPFTVTSPWFTGQANITTYPLEELLSTKFCALYQRKKGRDLYDLATAIRHLPLNIDKLLDCYHKYMEYIENKVFRAEFEKNLLQKKTLPSFQEDILPLLAIGNNTHSFDDDFTLVMEQLVTRLPGGPWKGIKEESA